MKNDEIPSSITQALTITLKGIHLMQRNRIARTPGQEFRCVYSCEKILSHIPIPAHGKDKKRSSARWQHANPRRHCNGKMNPMSHLSVFRIFWKSFPCFYYINEVFSGVQEKESILHVRME